MKETIPFGLLAAPLYVVSVSICGSKHASGSSDKMSTS
jgi:hypothetical protein